VVVDTGEREPERLRIFISYSRRDNDIIDQLVAALDVAGFEPQLDRHGTVAGEAWESRLSEMIAQADTVIFALTPDAAASTVCEWEVEEARRLGKRLIPIVAKPLGGVAVPEKLSRLDYTFFYAEPSVPGSGFGQGLRKLVAALKVDVEWLRDATRYGELARRWEAGGALANRLLSGADIALAKAWLERTPRDAPPLPDVVRRFISDSEAHEADRHAADAARQRATQITESGLLSRASASLLPTDPVGAMLLALEGMPDASQGIDRPWVSETHVALDQALRAAGERWVAVLGEELETVVFSPDGQRVASLSMDRRVRVIEAATGVVSAALAHADGAMAIVFTQDGRLLAARWEGEELHIVEAGTGEVVARCDRGEPAFSADGRFFMSASNDSVRVFETETCRQVAHFAGVTAASFVVAIAWGGESVAVASDEVRVHRIVDDGEFKFATSNLRKIVFGRNSHSLATLSTSTGEVRFVGGKIGWIEKFSYGSRLYTIAFSPDGTMMAAGAQDGTLLLFDLATGKTRQRFAHGAGVYGVTFSPDGRFVATACLDGTARLFDISRDGTFMRMGVASAVAFSPDGRLGAAKSSDGAFVFDMATGRSLALLDHGDSGALAFSPDGHVVAVASRDETVSLIEAATGRSLRTLPYGGGTLHEVAFSPAGGTVAILCHHPAVRLFDVASGEELARFEHDGEVASLAFRPDGLLLATGQYDGTVRFFDVTLRRERARRRLHGDAVLKIAFSPHGSILATASRDSTAQLFDIDRGETLARMAHEGEVTAILFSPEGGQLATASVDRTVRFFEAEHGRETARLDFADRAFRIAFSADGRLLTAALRDGTARVFCAATGAELARLDHGGWIRNSAFSREGTVLCTIGDDNVLRLWRIHADAQALVDEVKASAAHALTPAQRKTYFLPPAPPLWCVERRLWPYHTDAWQAWLTERKTGGEPPLPR
jgi:WD40 repeat protein